MLPTQGKLRIDGYGNIKTENGLLFPILGITIPTHSGGMMDEALANVRRLVEYWNERDSLVAERDRYKQRCSEMREGGLKLIEDHSQRTIEAMKLRQERDELVDVLRLERAAWSTQLSFNQMASIFAKVDSILAKYPEKKDESIRINRYAS